MRQLLLIATVIVALAFPAFGASSFLGGYSGNILTPDAVVTPTGTWEFSFHDITDADLSAIGLMYGITPNLEVGASFLNNDESSTAFNAKYRITPETVSQPTILVGVFDAFGSADTLEEDSSFFLVVSKNVTSTASEIAGEPSKPLRLSVGFGSGFFDGFFAGLDWTLSDQLSFMAEVAPNDVDGNSSTVNVGARYAATGNIRLDAALIDFEDFAWGASFRTQLR
ncbi:MAG: hypothetical protein ACYC2Y_04650 [Armatimonadota bacterium]